MNPLNLYGRWIYPALADRALQNPDAEAARARIVSMAKGSVLEIGIGSGLNLPYYGSSVRQLVGLDPSAEMLERLRQRAKGRQEVGLLLGSAEAIPLADAAFDTVVMTWALCGISDPLRALFEVRRVLRPEGRLLFIEHGLAPDSDVQRWQHRLDPLWTRISCHLDRPVDRLLDEAGFATGALTRRYIGAGPRFLNFMYEGWASPIRDVENETPIHIASEPS